MDSDCRALRPKRSAHYAATEWMPEISGASSVWTSNKQAQPAALTARIEIRSCAERLSAGFTQSCRLVLSPAYFRIKVIFILTVYSAILPLFTFTL